MPFLLKVMVYSVTLTLLGKVPESWLKCRRGKKSARQLWEVLWYLIYLFFIYIYMHIHIYVFLYIHKYICIYVLMNSTFLHASHPVVCHSSANVPYIRCCNLFFQGRFGWYLCVLVPNRRLPGGKHLRRVWHYFARNMWSKLNVFGHVKLSKMQGLNVLHGKLEVGKCPNFLMNALVIFGVIVQLSRKLWFRIYRYHQVLLRAIALQIK